VKPCDFWSGFTNQSAFEDYLVGFFFALPDHRPLCEGGLNPALGNWSFFA
jgi:hypothetical protein